jgi:hypothetical protein
MGRPIEDALTIHLGITTIDFGALGFRPKKHLHHTWYFGPSLIHASKT